MEDLQREQVKDTFEIEEIGGYFQYTMFFLNENGTRQFHAIGRTVNPGDEIFKKINESKNRVLATAGFEESDIGLIVTREMLDELGYKDVPSHINMSTPDQNNEYRPVPIPMKAVVKQLPGKSHFISTPYFYTKRFYSRYKPFNILDEEYSWQLEFFTPAEKSEARITGKELMDLIGTVPDWKDALLDYTVEDYSECFMDGFKIRIIFNEDWATHDSLDMIMEKIRTEFMPRKELTRIYSFNLSGNEPIQQKYDYLSVYFNSLDYIREFQSYIEKNHKLKIDMSSVESKENYNFVSRLTRIITVFLIGFSILGIVFFIINVLKSHIEKIKQNLGTFKAFGLSNRSLIRIYVYISVRFLVLSGLAALILAYAIGSLGAIRSFLTIFNTVVEENQDYFDLLNWVTYAAVISIVVVNAVIVRFSLAGILSRTPGDLIYSRD